MIAVSETSLLYYVFSRSMSTPICDTFIVSVEAVNGAGKSDPSDPISVVLPSLPDITPVTASLGHQLWKDSGEIMVMISFKV